uniref:Uncharacterized protein n=1 Tax=Palpitomonas bilix TaxID=652834 RepID=A0A7S3D8N9_9EUKA|mmetsp:Transcript_24952/g.62848  ORF Transcript_24952/g.62848 Transcript_24952/m.62848 type:complete len:122 (+) Transcript_24952:274-639(+)
MSSEASEKGSGSKGWRTVCITITSALLCAMLITIYYTIEIDGSPLRAELLTPWMICTLQDLYSSVLLIFGWVVYKERNVIVCAFWLVAFFLPGICGDDCVRSSATVEDEEQQCRIVFLAKV